MTIADIPLTLQTLFDNGVLPRRSYEARTRHVKLSFEWDKRNQGFVVVASGRLFPEDYDFQGFLKLSKPELHAQITNLQDVWQQKVIGLEYRDRQGKDRVFRDRLKLTSQKDREKVRQAGLEVARAGRKLFRLIFKSKKKADDGLKKIGQVLETGLRGQDCNLVFISDDCYVPWRMLYLPPEPETDLLADDASWEMAGFLGYRHVIEHKPKRRMPSSAEIEPVDGRVTVGLAVDENLDNEFRHPFVQPVVSFFKCFSGVKDHLKIWTKKLDLERAVASAYPDHILYFGCHGKVSRDPVESTLTLTDRVNPIKGSDLSNWFDENPPTRHPIIFINACQGGQMSSLFYESFATEFLKAGGHCLIGAQCDLPVVFASEFARKFFDELLQGERRIGEIVRDLTRRFADQHNNFLGLLYSLYYGLDTHLTQKVS